MNQHHQPATNTMQENLHDPRYAFDLEEYANGLICFAAPIRDHEGRVVGTVGQSVLTLYYTQQQMVEQLGPRVTKAAREISIAMGWCDDTGGE